MMRRGGKRILALCVALAFVIGTLWGTGITPMHGIFAEVEDEGAETDGGLLTSEVAEVEDEDDDFDEDDLFDDEEAKMLRKAIRNNALGEDLDEPETQTMDTQTNDDGETTGWEDEMEAEDPDSEGDTSDNGGGRFHNGCG